MALIDKTDITPEEIAYEGLNALDDKYQKSIGFFAWDFFVAMGKIIYDLWQKVIYIAKCLTDLSTMSEEDLINFVYQTRGIIAKTASPSRGMLTITQGTGEINAGTIFETADKLQFKALNSTKVTEGDKIEIECLTAGIKGNVPKNSITIIPTTITGIVSVTNEEAFTNGYDAETKEDLLDRYYEDLQTPITSGNIYHYKKWAKEVIGVGDAKIKPLWNGDNTVKVVIIDSNKQIPTEDLVEEVQNYIDPKSQWGCGLGQAPIGAYCTVTGAQAKELRIQVTVTLKTGMEKETVTNNIQESIKKYLASIAFDESTPYISYAKIGAIIMGADGVKDYTSLIINGTTDNILLTDDNNTTEVAILSEVEVTETEV